MNKMKMFTISAMSVIMLVLATVTGVRADAYGADPIVDLISGLWNSFWPLIALLFIITIILSIFTAPVWLKKIFGMVK